jgi:hypothetical protein
MRPEVGLHREPPVRSGQSMTSVENILDVSESADGGIAMIRYRNQ